MFWSQYAEAGHPISLSDQLKQLVELHRASEVAMKDFIVRMWPGEPLPTSYFGLIKRMVNVCLRLVVIKPGLYPCEGALGQARCREPGEGWAARGQATSHSGEVL